MLIRSLLKHLVPVQCELTLRFHSRRGGWEWSTPLCPPQQAPAQQGRHWPFTEPLTHLEILPISLTIWEQENCDLGHIRNLGHFLWVFPEENIPFLHPSLLCNLFWFGLFAHFSKPAMICLTFLEPWWAYTARRIKRLTFLGSRSSSGKHTHASNGLSFHFYSWQSNLKLKGGKMYNI